MNILYGVAGDGFGHSSRALIVAEFLEKKGHNVVILTYGRAVDVLKKRFKVFRVSGLFVVFVKGALKKRKTIKYNVKSISKNISGWKKFHKLMKEFKPDLCISDMEPIVPILSNWYKKPLISFDNQHRLTNLDVAVPKKYYKDYLIAKTVVNSFVSRAEHFIVTSFSSAKLKKKRTTVVSPIIRKDVRNLKPKYGKKILVYLTRKNPKVIKILEEINEKFIVYGYNIKKRKNNLEFKKKDNFLDDLKDCKAIIATAGFTLMSEAIYLKKPYLALPLKGQFEQVLNALFLKKAGFGEYADELEEKDLIYFLYNLEKYKKNLKNYKFDFEKLFKTFEKLLKRFEK
ncbi:hypothetical protein GOV06_04750 [Candidatus Woesearchaeota archaeon]|nr:hypothetical protein [Candidatus Woesearchaeota archaeon]